VFQIASLKAALARKEGNSEHSLSGSSGKYRTTASELSPYHASQRAADIVDGPFGFRQPVIDVGNLEVCISKANNFMHLTRSSHFSRKIHLAKFI
jgi:kinesin family protein C2/C3